MATNSHQESPATGTVPKLSSHKISVLLVDDQVMIGEAIRRMLASEEDIVFDFCSEPKEALTRANELQPTVILQDLVMPDVDGLTLLKFFRANEKTKDTPMIVLSVREDPTVKAQAFDYGANDYLVKLPDRVELIARIRYHSEAYIRLLQRNEAYEQLVRSQERLAEDIHQAASYVESLLPAPITEGYPKADWRFKPSEHLGGDTHGYHDIDDDYFAMYLLDVCGHGVGAALLAVSVINVLRSQSLPDTDFLDPGKVVASLNNTFKMREQNNMIFTIWYGVYCRSTRVLKWSGGGHPPSLLYEPGSATPDELGSFGPMIGIMDGIPYQSGEREIVQGSKLFLYSDGVYEIRQPNGQMWPHAGFKDFMGQPAATPDQDKMDHLYNYVHEMNGTDILDDDFSILEVLF